MDERKKQAILMAVLAFNITFILFTVLFNAGLPPLRWQFTASKAILGALIAAGAAVGGFFASRVGQ